MRRRACLLAALLPLAGCAPSPPLAEPPALACPRSDNWQAWIDAMPGPGSQPRLIVDGEVDVPAGMVASLREGPLDRMMPPGQRFALELTPGKGPAGLQRVRIEVKPALPQYREIVIGCGGETIARITDIKTAH